MKTQCEVLCVKNRFIYYPPAGHPLQARIKSMEYISKPSFRFKNELEEGTEM